MADKKFSPKSTKPEAPAAATPPATAATEPVVAAPDTTLADTKAAAADATIAALQARLAIAELQLQQAAPVKSEARGQFVGIRNISNNTLGLPESPLQHEQAATLHAQGDQPDPGVVAVVSYPYWMQLRKSKFYGLGLITRDDSVLGPNHEAAPEDEERDLEPGAKVNAVVNPYEWIVSKNEHELKIALNAMTSEASLRRLAWAIQQQVTKFFEALSADDPRRLDKAVEQLSAHVLFAEKLILDRLDMLAAPYRTDIS